MQTKQKKRFFLNHRKSSALVVSVLVHAVFIVVALTFVAVSVVMKDEVDFVPKEVRRPKMKLRKLQVPVKQDKKTQAPKLRQNIVAKPRLKDVVIKMPEVVGVPGGTYGAGEGLGGLGFGLNLDMDLFGSNSKGAGSTFVGHFYDLKQTSQGTLSEMGELMARAVADTGGTDWDALRSHPSHKASCQKYREVIARFLSGWDESRLDDYFMAPREKFATTFIIPRIGAEEAPKAYGVEDEVDPREWLALYRGEITAPETGKYRFVGRGDDVLMVRVKKRLVIDASWSHYSDWRSSDPDNNKYRSYNDEMSCIIGDWFHLQKGRPVPMEVLIGEEPGGNFFCQLYIQKEGEQYPVTTETHTGETVQRPILPIFKTAPVPDKIVGQMQINPAWATVEGPGFGGGG